MSLFSAVHQYFFWCCILSTFMHFPEISRTRGGAHLSDEGLCWFICKGLGKWTRHAGSGVCLNLWFFLLFHLSFGIHWWVEGSFWKFKSNDLWIHIMKEISFQGYVCFHLVILNQVHQEFRQSCDELTVLKLLETFINSKKTGEEKPGD